MRPGIHVAPRVHAALALVVCAVLPAVSWLDGSGQLAWTMFCKTGLYRLRVVAHDAAGGGRVIDPMRLAVAAGRSPAASFLTGADRWRHHDVGRATLRRHLDDVARLACGVAPAREIEITLEERANLDAPVRTSAARVACGR